LTYLQHVHYFSNFLFLIYNNFEFRGGCEGGFPPNGAVCKSICILKAI